MSFPDRGRMRFGGTREFVWDIVHLRRRLDKPMGMPAGSEVWKSGVRGEVWDRDINVGFR